MQDGCRTIIAIVKTWQTPSNEENKILYYTDTKAGLMTEGR